jgi:hypothetical protein
MKRALLVIIVGLLYVLHQDFWFWRAAHPLVFGFLPVGLFYHACYTVATVLVMILLVRIAWPSELEEGVGDSDRPLAASPLRPVPLNKEDVEH